MKLFRQLFVFVLAIGIMSNIVYATNLISSDEKPNVYAVNGVDAYSAPRNAAKNFDVENIVYFVNSEVTEQLSLDSNSHSNVTVVRSMDALLEAAQLDPFAAIIVDAGARSLLDKEALIKLSQKQHLVLIIGFDSADDIDKDFEAPVSVNYEEYAFATYVITPEGDFSVFDFWPVSVNTLSEALAMANKTKNSAYTIYNLFVCGDDYSEASPTELAAASVIDESSVARVAGTYGKSNRVELFRTWMAGMTTGYVYTTSACSTVLKTVHNGEAIIFTGVTNVVEDTTFYQVKVWTSNGSLSYGWMPPIGSYMDYPFTWSLTNYAESHESPGIDGLIVYDETYGAGYKLAYNSNLYNSSGNIVCPVSSYTRVWFTDAVGTAGATMPYLVTISGYSTYENNEWTYHALNATTFVDAGFDAANVSSYKMHTLEE